MCLPAWVDTLNAWQSRIRMDKKLHCYVVQTQPGGPWVPVDGTTDTMPKDKDSVAGLCYWAAGCAEEEAADRLEKWEAAGRVGYKSVRDIVAGIKSAHVKKRDTAASLGTDGHLILENEARRMMGEIVPEPPSSVYARQLVSKWRRWAESVSLRPLAVEVRLFNPCLMHAGTADLVALVNGNPEVIDYKGSDKAKNKLYRDHHLQGSAYRKALQLMTGMDAPIGGRIVFFPRPSGDLTELQDFVLTGDVEAAAAAFAACLILHRWTRSLSPKKQMEAAS
jgi:hypothetical protein